MLGPILFLVLLGDIDGEVANSFLSSFADDMRVSMAINTAADVGLLQKDLYCISVNCQLFLDV